MFTVTGVRTWRELRGENCICVDDIPQNRSICTSRSFSGQGLSCLSELEEAVANFMASCVRKLRDRHACCRQFTVFAYTSRFRTDLPRYSINRTMHFQVPTNNLQELVSAAVNALRAGWQEGENYWYKKAGVIVWDITDDSAIQTDLFDTVDRVKQRQLSEVIDAINKKNGQNTIKVAIQGESRLRSLKCEHLTKQYTTNVEEVIQVKI